MSEGEDRMAHEPESGAAELLIRIVIQLLGLVVVAGAVALIVATIIHET